MVSGTLLLRKNDTFLFANYTLCANHSNLVPFSFKMVPARFFAIKMCRKSKYVHRPIYLTPLKIAK